MPLPSPGSQTNLPDPNALTVQCARPLTVTKPEPNMLAVTWPSDANLLLPEPATLTSALSTFSPPRSALPLPAMFSVMPVTAPAALTVAVAPAPVPPPPVKVTVGAVV